MEDIQTARAQFEKLGILYPKDETVKVEPETLADVNCYWFTPNSAAESKIIVYLHGGAFAAGSIRSHESMVSHLAASLQTRILFVEYALAPEQPYPAGVNDAVKVYMHLLAIYPGYRFDVIGDSAGGGIAVTMLGELQRHKLLLPAAMIIISPWLDLACNNPSYAKNKDADVVLKQEYLKIRAAMYAGNMSAEQASPNAINFHAFPPVLIMVGTNEILLDDSKNFYHQIKPIQPAALLTLYDQQYHVWPLANIHSDASKQAIAEMQLFLK